YGVAHVDDSQELLDRLRPPSAEVGQHEPPPLHELTQPLEQHERASLVQDRRRVELIHCRRRKETSWWRRERHGVTRLAFVFNLARAARVAPDDASRRKESDFHSGGLSDLIRLRRRISLDRPPHGLNGRPAGIWQL